MTLPQRASEIDVTLLRRLAQRSLMNVTERTVKTVYANIYVEVGGFPPEAVTAKALLLFVGTRNPRSTFSQPILQAFSVQPGLKHNST